MIWFTPLASASLSAPLLLVAFATALLVALAASAWFTRTLEILCDRLGLSIGLLSLLSALGANIPNYAASLVAFAEGQAGVGISIIIGSNIWNLGIILGISTFAPSTGHGLPLRKEGRDIRLVALYTIGIALLTLLVLTLFEAGPPGGDGHLTFAETLAIAITNLLIIGLFGVLVSHALRRFPHASEEISDEEAANDAEKALALSEAPAAPVPSNTIALGETPRSVVTAIFALLIALGGVIVMVQAGQAFALDVHLSPVLLGLVVLAAATSLPNTVVAVSMARSNRVAACVEEVLTSNNINVVLGSTLPLLLWHVVFLDRWLVLLDAPLMVVLTLIVLACLPRGRISRAVGLLLVALYVSWVVAHVLL
jgi:cation:H+ antiporter